ncbi:unnamed protein product, partial [Urochloa humidicola]
GSLSTAIAHRQRPSPAPTGNKGGRQRHLPGWPSPSPLRNALARALRAVPHLPCDPLRLRIPAAADVATRLCLGRRLVQINDGTGAAAFGGLLHFVYADALPLPPSDVGGCLAAM